MKNSTKGVLALLSAIIAATMIVLITLLLLVMPAETIKVGGVLFLMLGSVIVLVGLSMVGVDAILKREK